MTATETSQWHEMPADILKILSKVHEGVEELRQLSAKDKVLRQFTLDGRFVGDIGEWLVARRFAVALDKQQRKGHDATVIHNGLRRDVQIKCRCESDAIDFKQVPDFLLVLEVQKDWSAWRVVYNGPGRLAVDLTGKSRVRQSLKQLGAAQIKVLMSDQISLKGLEG